MTKLLDKAVAAARELSSEEQDEIARTIFEMLDEVKAEPLVLTEAENAAIDRSLLYADRGEFVSDEDVRSIFAKYSR
jgi:predicted transcriptional regulator